MLPGDSQRYDQMQREKFEAFGAEATRRMLIEGKLGERKGKIAQAWLDEHEGRTEAEQREIDRDLTRATNSIATKAIARSTWSNIIASLALVVAIIAAAHEWLK